MSKPASPPQSPTCLTLGLAQVVLAEPGIRALAGHLYLSPRCDRHMCVSEAGDFSIKLREGRPISGCMPSVAVLYQSAAKVAGAKGLFAMAQAGAIPLPRTRRPASSSVCRARQSRSAPQRLAAIGPANAGFSRAFLKLANLLRVDCHETAVEHIEMEALQARFRLEQSASDARL
jgi:hypothetical protein